MKTRIEKDSLGEMKVPEDAYYAAQTQRAVENFPISGQRFPQEFIYAMGLIKYANAKANSKLNLLEKKYADPIMTASTEVMNSKHDDQMVVDIYQTGSGTSTNMNINEVIASRATEILTGSKTGSPKIHPNDHINLGQSSNDVIPTAIHISSLYSITKNLLPELKNIRDSMGKKSAEFKTIVKIGRTHLQDATPITLGQEFSGYEAQLEKAIDRISQTLPSLEELALGGTAVGTGLNSRQDKTKLAIEYISTETGIKFRETSNHFEAQASKDAIVHTSGALKTLAVSLMKIANDIRWLGSGPRCGLGEIILPATQPGSSIMPGKVNPVQAEALTMVCARVIGNDAAITLAGQSGNFELNVMMPVIAYSILESIKIMTNGIKSFNEKCLKGIKADKKQIEFYIEKSLALVTSLVPVIGYDKSAELAKQAFKENKTIRQLLLEENLLSEEKINTLLDVKKMTGPY